MKHSVQRLAGLQHALAAVLVVSTLLPSGLLPGNWESRAHEQVNQLLRVINRIGRLKSADRELQAAERRRRAQVFCSGRQPSELRLAHVEPPHARAISA
ncbi:MAG: hypothetical protein ABI887_02895 [Burkholderiales bacterium]